jgi:hypothetical protein
MQVTVVHHLLISSWALFVIIFISTMELLAAGALPQRPKLQQLQQA